MNDPRHRYYEQAGSWAADAQAADARAKRTAWIVAGVAVGIALLEAVALILLTPLKTVVPVTLLVDRQTGYVQALNPLEPRRVGADAALTRSFLVQYVIAREGFDLASVQDDYRKVALWSAGPARASYLALMPASNPESPFRRYPRDAVVRVTVKSVSQIGTGASLVRFDTQLTRGQGQAEPAQAWAAVVRHRYTDQPMSTADRFLNPLGFQVTGYRRDPEVLPVAQPAAAATAAAPTSAQTPAAARPTVIAPPGSVAIVVPARRLPIGSPLTPPQ